MVAVLHGYLNLLLAHKFLQRESIDMAIFRSVCLSPTTTPSSTPSIPSFTPEQTVTSLAITA